MLLLFLRKETKCMQCNQLGVERLDVGPYATYSAHGRRKLEHAGVICYDRCSEQCVACFQHDHADTLSVYLHTSIDEWLRMNMHV